MKNRNKPDTTRIEIMKTLVNSNEMSANEAYNIWREYAGTVFEENFKGFHYQEGSFGEMVAWVEFLNKEGECVYLYKVGNGDATITTNIDDF